MAEKNDVAMVFNVYLHCEGCAQTVRKWLMHFKGVKSVKTDLKSDRLTVTGNVDAAFVKRILEEKTNQKVDFRSPPKSDGKSEKKKKNDVAMVFNVYLHCEGCAQTVRKWLMHFKGVKSVKTDLKSDRLTVTGNVDAAFVKRILEEKTNQKVDFQSPPKSDGKSEKKKAEGKKSKEV